MHHGQGTQRMFYNDPKVLYFSIHRYEYGTFWPNLRESDFDAIGEDAGKGFNFNVPLNATGMTNGDYLAIWQQLLMPVAMEVIIIKSYTQAEYQLIHTFFYFIPHHQYQPELIIISAGYDAAYGCPEVCAQYLFLLFLFSFFSSGIWFSMPRA